MKIASNIVNFFALNYIVNAKSPPNIVFENFTPNNSWVFASEYNQNSRCDFDSCHEVLKYLGKQWVAFPYANGTQTITYKICDTPEVYINQCAYYSDIHINVTSSLTNVTVTSASPQVKDIQVRYVKENQSDSEAVLSLYQIQFTVLPSHGTYTNQTTHSADQHTRISVQLLLWLISASLFATALFILISKKGSHKAGNSLSEQLMEHPTHTIKNSLLSLFFPRSKTVASAIELQNIATHSIQEQTLFTNTEAGKNFP